MSFATTNELKQIENQLNKVLRQAGRLPGSPAHQEEPLEMPAINWQDKEQMVDYSGLAPTQSSTQRTGPEEPLEGASFNWQTERQPEPQGTQRTQRTQSTHQEGPLEMPTINWQEERTER
jgi:hypothetical protein